MTSIATTGWRGPGDYLGLEALTALGRRGIEPADFGLDQPSLDEVFLALTGRRPDREEPHGDEVA